MTDKRRRVFKHKLTGSLHETDEGSDAAAHWETMTDVLEEVTDTVPRRKNGRTRDVPTEENAEVAEVA